jgi:hypothetical protein
MVETLEALVDTDFSAVKQILGEREAGGTIGGVEGSYGGGELEQAIRESKNVGVGVASAGLTADTMLRALRAVGCDYRSDLSVADGAWIGYCPLCRRSQALRVWETSEWNAGGELSPPFASAFCRAGCAQVAVLRFLATPVRVLEAEDRERRMTARYRWAVRVARQLLEVC